MGVETPDRKPSTPDKLLEAILDRWHALKTPKLSTDERARITARIRAYAELYLRAADREPSRARTRPNKTRHGAYFRSGPNCRAGPRGTAPARAREPTRYFRADGVVQDHQDTRRTLRFPRLAVARRGAWAANVAFIRACQPLPVAR